MYCKLTEKNNELEPKPFQIFLSGGAGVGKSFLVTTITQYLNRILRYPSQNLDNSSVLVTSTGKAAANVSGIKLHSAFNLPVKSVLKSCGYQKPSEETYHKLRNKYQYLKVLIIDEISMIRRETFEDLDLALKNIKQNLLQFDGVSLLLVGDRAEQCSDPDFAHVLNRVREGQHTNDYLTQIKALANTNTATWPDEFLKVYLNNYLPGKENNGSIRKLDSAIVVFKAQDCKRKILK